MENNSKLQPLQTKVLSRYMVLNINHINCSLYKYKLHRNSTLSHSSSILAASAVRCITAVFLYHRSKGDRWLLKLLLVSDEPGLRKATCYMLEWNMRDILEKRIKLQKKKKYCWILLRRNMNLKRKKRLSLLVILRDPWAYLAPFPRGTAVPSPFCFLSSLPLCSQSQQRANDSEMQVEMVTVGRKQWHHTINRLHPNSK